MKNVVIQELENYRGRTEQRFMIMMRTASRNGLNHVFPGTTLTLEQAVKTCQDNGWKIEAIGDFYHVV